MNTVLITGATAGIGEACAEKYAIGGNRIIITGRRTEKLKSVSERLKKEYQSEVIALNFDVRDKTAVKKEISSVLKNVGSLDILINNAGLALGKDKIDEGRIDDWEQMIDTNVKGLLYVTEACIPFLKKSDQGHIVNLGSISGKETYLSGNVYCASKYAVDALSQAFRIDLLPHGIRVTNIAPGMVETEFSFVRFKGDKDRAEQMYKGFKPLLAQDVANVIFFATQQPAHININDLVITSTAQANSFYTHKTK